MTQNLMKLQKAVLLLFCRTPLYNVVLGLLGDRLLEFVKANRCPEMFADPSLFMQMEQFDAGVDSLTKEKYVLKLYPVVTASLADLSSLSGLERLVDAIHSGLSSVVSNGRCVPDSVRLVMERGAGAAGTLDLWLAYMEVEE